MEQNDRMPETGGLSFASSAEHAQQFFFVNYVDEEKLKKYLEETQKPEAELVLAGEAVEFLRGEYFSGIFYRQWDAVSRDAGEVEEYKEKPVRGLEEAVTRALVVAVMLAEQERSYRPRLRQVGTGRKPPPSRGDRPLLGNEEMELLVRPLLVLWKHEVDRVITTGRLMVEYFRDEFVQTSGSLEERDPDYRAR